MARHCRTRHPWLPVARRGRPKLTPDNPHADHEAQAVLEVVASTDGREHLTPSTGVVPSTGVALSPLDLLATVASAATPLPTNDQSTVQMAPTSDPGVAKAPPAVPQDQAAADAKEVSAMDVTPARSTGVAPALPRPIEPRHPPAAASDADDEQTMEIAPAPSTGTAADPPSTGTDTGTHASGELPIFLFQSHFHFLFQICLATLYLML